MITKGEGKAISPPRSYGQDHPIPVLGEEYPLLAAELWILGDLPQPEVSACQGEEI